MTAALAADFHGLDPKLVQADPAELVAKGKTIYDEGIAVGQCSGMLVLSRWDAKSDGLFPRLAGQLFDYLSNRLTHWDKGRRQESGRSGSSVIMQPIARSLTAASESTSHTLPVVRRMARSDLLHSLECGFDDFSAMPSHAIFLSVIYPLLCVFPTARWGSIIAALLPIGSIPFLLGLTVVMPVLPHAM